ncbi:MAG: arginine--tRNA ligase [Bacteroidetes bacterium]|jgi:arginyl-tRNA synthetase|nr:arginine--tRNA ligase [Bacteroidota bacterium]
MKDYLDAQLRTTLASIDGVPDDFEPMLEKPNDPSHGDLATNAALQLARHLRKAPRQIAEELVEQLDLDANRIADVSVAGPGFINFRFAEEFLADALADILEQDAAFGRADEPRGNALVEYVSANPTGPLTVGHGRNAVLGDTIANLLDWAGYDVTREYYFNDAGRQMRVLAQSVKARCEGLLRPQEPTKHVAAGADEPVEVPASFPEDGYLGQYIIDIAQAVVDAHGDDALDLPLEAYQQAAQQTIFAMIEDTLQRLDVRMSGYFNERSLYDKGKIAATLQALRDEGMVYEADGATWFKTTAFGKEDDTVLVKSTGEPTYRLPDIAYHVEKFERGFDVMIDVFGADHIATYPDILSALDVLGYDKSRVDVVIYQFVTLVRAGEPVKMSTRKANYVTLDELIDEVTPDVARFFFLMRSANTHLDFDLDLAKEASDKNPVFYLQYAHARICSILRKAAEVGFEADTAADLGLLTHPAEVALIKTLRRLPGEVQKAAEARAPHYMPGYLREVAVAFTKFYDQCRIIGEDHALASARMALARATRRVLANGLTVLGIAAPERM